MKWSERTAQGFSPGTIAVKCALKVAAEAHGHGLVVYPTTASNVGCHFQGTFYPKLTQGCSLRPFH
ncbi:MAG TPA: hypothetical protein VE641_07190, partial [Chthoniobacterales bacterium]|nr:hypothetical protein [Chthoniobacterales bacterium]